MQRRSGVLIPLVAILALVGAASSAAAATLRVEVDGLRSQEGRIAATLCTEETFLDPECAMAASAPARTGVVVIHDVPPGVYAVQAFHDENANSRIDMTTLGLPREGIGFSRDAPMHFGPPNFYDAAVRMDRSDARLSITIRYP